MPKKINLDNLLTDIKLHREWSKTVFLFKNILASSVLRHSPSKLGLKTFHFDSSGLLLRLL